MADASFPQPCCPCCSLWLALFLAFLLEALTESLVPSHTSGLPCLSAEARVEALRRTRYSGQSADAGWNA